MNSAWKYCFSNWINVTNIYGVIRPFYYVAKLYGFAPFQLNDQKISPQDGVTNVGDWIIILFSLTGYSYVIYVLWDFECNDKYFNEHVIVTISRGILFFITNLVSMVCVVSNILFRKGLQKVATDFHRIDNELKNEGCDIPHRKHFLVVITCITLQCCLHGMVIVSSISVWKLMKVLSPNEFVEVGMTFFYGTGAYSVYVHAYFLSLLIATSRVDYINQLIRELPNINSPTNYVRNMAIIYDKLCDVVDALNKYMSVQIMVFMSCTLGFNIFTIFSFYIKINAKHTYDNLKTDLVLSILWSAFYSIPSLTVIFIGALLRRKGRETGIIIHKTLHLILEKTTMKQFKGYGSEVSQSKHFIIVLSFVIFYLFMQFLLVSNIFYFYSKQLYGSHSYNFLIQMFVFIYAVGGYLVVMSYYLFSVMAITCRFQLLNDNIGKSGDIDASLVVRIAKTYDKLCDTVEFLNYILSFEIMFLLTINFGFHVISVFIFYKHFYIGSWYHFENVHLQISASTFVVSIIWHFYYLSVSILVIVSGAMLSKHGRKTGGLVHKRINMVNEKATYKEISALGISIPHKQHYKFVVVHILIFSTIQIGAMIFTCAYLQKHYNPSMKSRFNCVQACFVYFYGIGAFSMTMSYYYLSLLAVYTRFRHVNDYIKNIFTNVPDTDSKDIDRCLIVRQISKIYDALCDIVETINFCFSFQVMALLTACFGFAVFCVFTLYKAAFTHPSNANIFVRNLVLNLVWNFHYSIIAFSVIYVGSNLSYQGLKTGVLVHKAIYYMNDDKVIDKLRLFSQQLQHRTPVATCGLFPFDWTLLYSTFAASVTYLIILIQFDTSSGSGNSFTLNQTERHHHGH